MVLINGNNSSNEMKSVGMYDNEPSSPVGRHNDQIGSWNTNRPIILDSLSTFSQRG